MKKHLLFYLLTLGFAFTALSQGWLDIGTDYSSNEGVIAISKQDTMFTAFQEYDGVSAWRISVKKYNGTDWEYVGAAKFSAGDAEGMTIAVNNAGIPYVAYQDAANSNVLAVKKFDGTNWVDVGTNAIPGATTGMPYIKFDNNDVLHVAMRYFPNFGFATGAVVKYDGSAWSFVGERDSLRYQQYPRLEFDSNNTPFYCANSSSGFTSFRKFDGTNWLEYAESITGGGFQKVDMGIYNDEIYAFFIDGANSNYGTVKKYNGSNWVDIGVAGFTPEDIDNPNMRIDAYGNIYVAFADKGQSNWMTVMKYDGSTWELMGTRGEDLYGAAWNGVGRCIALNSHNELFRFNATTNSRAVQKYDCVIEVPDANFKAYLVADTTINVNGDTSIQCYEANEYAGGIDCNGLSIADLTGIEHFTKLSTLNCSSNQLTALDLSSNVSLTTLNCSNNQIASLNLTKNGSLTDVDVSDNALTSLDLRNGKNTDVVTFDATGNTSLDCIQVDDAAYSTTNWTNIEAGTSFGDITTAVTVSGATITADYASATAYQWIDCDNGNADVAGATSQSFNPSANGNYACVISKGNCEETTECKEIATVGIALDEKASIELFPNPTSNQFQIRTSLIVKNVVLLDLTGRTIDLKVSTNGMVQVEGVAKGIYAVQIVTTKGVYVRQILISK